MTVNVLTTEITTFNLVDPTSTVPHWSIWWRHRSSSMLIGQLSYSYQMPLTC